MFLAVLTAKKINWEKKNPLINKTNKAFYVLATDTTNTQMNMDEDSVCAKC